MLRGHLYTQMTSQKRNPWVRLGNALCELQLPVLAWENHTNSLQLSKTLVRRHDPFLNGCSFKC